MGAIEIVAIAGGAYLVGTTLLKLDPIHNISDNLNSIINAAGSWISSITGGGGGTKRFQWILSKDSARQGDTISIYAFDLPPGQQMIYGWNEIGPIATVTADAQGVWWSPDILISANPGTYHIYLDLTPWGGDKSTRIFTVLA